MQELNNSNKNIEPIVFVNTPITSNIDDVIGFSSQVDTIINAIDNENATIIGIIADYGTGKSSMTELLKKDYLKPGYPKPIQINMWDTLPKSENSVSDGSISDLTKSFLFQLANGYDARFGSYINKLLSKNYGTISFASNHPIRLFVFLILSVICFSIHKMAEISESVITPYLSLVFILLSFVLAFGGIKDICIAFSHWKMTNQRIPEISDIFDIYRIIVERFAKNNNKKRLVFIDDLDRINDKTSVVNFLKEIYRFQNSICEDKSRFVFIVSVMPESNLPKNTADDNDPIAVFSKIFDTTIYLKPIHFDDYDSILLQLIKEDKKKCEALEQLIGEEIGDYLPDSFKWIKRGSNLTLRDLKERLNQAIAIMVSLINKSYVGNSAANFQACTAVSYLENCFPDDYYNLIKCEVQFAEFIQKCLPIINELSEKSNDELQMAFREIFIKEDFSQLFVSELCLLITSGIIDDDFRMYFYTYPKGSHIKTTSEREICDYLLFPNQKTDYSNLPYAVEQAFKSGTNATVEAEIRNRPSFPLALLEHDILFKKSAEIDEEKLFAAFKKYCLDTINFVGNDVDIWKRVLCLGIDQKDNLLKKIVATLLKAYPNDSIVPFRMKMILAFGSDIISCSEAFINDNVPIISSEEINAINNQLISIQLINNDMLTEKSYRYINGLILQGSLIDKDKDVFNKALDIYGVYSTMLKERISNDVLSFLKLNHYMNDKSFEFIYAHIDDNELVDYINEFIPNELSDTYLSCLNKKCLLNGLSNELLQLMIEKGYFITPLIHYSEQKRLQQIDCFESNVTDILSACATIHTKYPDSIINIRSEAYISRGISDYLELYAAPYPLVTDKEYLMDNDDIEKTISLIDVERITDNDFEQVSTIHLRTYKQSELFLLLQHIFNNPDSITVLDRNTKNNLIQALDLNRLGYKQLSFEQRDQIYTLIGDALNVNGAEEIIDFLKSVDCLIPILEKKIANNSLYPTLFSQFNELTNASIQWLSDNYITCALPEKLCDKLYELQDYPNYIIASTLRTGNLSINDKIPFSNYLEIYDNSKEIFEIMSNNNEFLELFQQNADFSEYDMTHIKPAYKTRQHKAFFTYIDALSAKEKIEYYMTFGKLASLNDSAEFRRIVCRKDNIELLGDYKIFNHIREQLWSDKPSEKGLFTRAWNKRWKNNL